MIKFTREALAATPAGQLLENQKTLTRKENFRQKLAEDPSMIKRGYEHGWIQLGENGERVLFVRSRWDGNICAYFEFLKQKGQIKKWSYEAKTFWFHKIKRGTNNYKPDFIIEELDGRETVIEVKAYWTSKDTVKMNRMKKYHPGVRIMILGDDKCYKRMNEKFAGVKVERYTSYTMIKANAEFIPGWNQKFLKREQVDHLIPMKTKGKVSVTPPDLFNS